MKKILRSFIFISIFLSGNYSFAQSTGYLSMPLLNGNPFFYNATHTSDGGFITVGISGTAGVNNEMIKWDANMHVVWAQNFQSANFSLWQDVIETNDGNYVALAMNYAHGGSMYAVKCDAVTGTVLFQKEYYVGPTNLSAFCLCKAAGNNDPGFVFGGGACAYSNYLIRCDGSGNILWQKEYYISNMTGVESIEAIHAENNHYIVAGNAASSQHDVFIMRIDSSGNSVTWCNYISEPAYDEIPSRILKLSTGNYAILCGFNNNPNEWKLLYYFTSTGSVIGGTKLVDPGNRELDLMDMAEVSNGEIMVAGDYTDSISSSQTRIKYYFAELNSTGTIIWQKKSTGITPGYLNGMVYGLTKTSSNLFAGFGSCATDGKTIMVIDSLGNGLCNSGIPNILNANPDPYTIGATTPIIINTNVLDTVSTISHSLFALTPTNLCGALGIDQQENENSLFAIFPNPVTREINLDFGGKIFEKADVVFYNVLGEKVYSVELKNSSSLDISSLSDGVYVMEVFVGGKRFVKRVVKN